MNPEAIRRRGVTEPALHTRPARSEAGTARRRQGSTPPPRRVPFEPPPRGEWAHGHEPPEIIVPEPVQDKGACFTEIAMHINEAIAQLCQKFDVFAGCSWHPQHRNRSCLFTPSMIERGQHNLPPPDLSPERLLRLQDATQRFYFFLKTWYRRSAVNNLDHFDMQAVGKAFMKGFFEPWGDLNNPGGRLKEMLMTHMTEKNPSAALDEVERTLCRKCRHVHFEHNQQHFGNFSKLIDEGGWHSLFYVCLLYTSDAADE